jgi:hypothetical protein
VWQMEFQLVIDRASYGSLRFRSCDGLMKVAQNYFKIQSSHDLSLTALAYFHPFCLGAQTLIRVCLQILVWINEDLKFPI